MTPKLKAVFDEATARPLSQDGYRILDHNGYCIVDLFHACTVNDLLDALANARLLTLGANHFEAVVEALEKTSALIDVCVVMNIIDRRGLTGEVMKQAHAVLATIEKDLEAF